jgi:hypothetical protein
MAERNSNDRGFGEQGFSAVMRHHRAAWRVERVGWALVAAILVATLFGAFGDGPLSRAASGSQAFRVEYDRLLRASAPAELKVRAGSAAAQGGLLRLRIARSLVDRMEFDSIVPQPLRQVAGPGYTEFVFPVAGGGGAVDINVRYRPATFGRQSGAVSLVGSDTLLIRQYVFP